MRDTRTLADLGRLLPMATIKCGNQKCGRLGRNRTERLARSYGGGMTIPALLDNQSRDCPRRDTIN